MSISKPKSPSLRSAMATLTASFYLGLLLTEPVLALPAAAAASTCWRGTDSTPARIISDRKAVDRRQIEITAGTKVKTTGGQANCQQQRQESSI